MKIVKVSKVKTGLIVVVSIIILVTILSYINFSKLDIYQQNTNGNIISKGGVLYQFDGVLTSSYSGGDLKANKVIGRFEGENFFTTLFLGPRIVELKDYDGKNTFLVRGVMLQEVYTKIDK
jgi:hypothetical protein